MYNKIIIREKRIDNMEKKASSKKSTSKKTQVKATAKAAPKKTNQVKTAKKTTNKKKQVVKTQKKSQISKSRQNANTGYLLGLSSLVAWVIPIVGTIVTVTGIYCCYSGMKNRKTLACIGLILNVLFLGLALINITADFALMK